MASQLDRVFESQSRDVTRNSMHACGRVETCNRIEMRHHISSGLQISFRRKSIVYSSQRAETHRCIRACKLRRVIELRCVSTFHIFTFSHFHIFTFSHFHIFTFS